MKPRTQMQHKPVTRREFNELLKRVECLEGFSQKIMPVGPIPYGPMPCRYDPDPELLKPLMAGINQPVKLKGDPDATQEKSDPGL